MYFISLLKVKDRSVIKTSWDETRVTEPTELQDAIDQLVSEKRFARSFVRYVNTGYIRDIQVTGIAT